MAFTVSIAPLTPTGVIGASQTFTATTATPTAEGTDSFVWTVDGVAQSSVIATMDYILAAPAGSKVVKVVATHTATEGGATETAEAETTVTVTKKIMTLGCSIVSDKMTPKHGEQVTLTATGTGAVAGALSEYIWKLDGVAIGAPKTSTYIFMAGDVGTKKYTCTYEAMHQDYEPAAKTSNELSIVIGKADQQSSVVLTASKFEVEQGEVLPVDAVTASSPVGATITYAWNLDGSIIPGQTTDAYEFSSQDLGPHDIYCTVSITHPNYVDFSKDTNTVSIEVKEKEIVPAIDPYVHPLPWRNTAYIWCGWWVMFEIQKISQAGGNWKSDEVDSPFYQHRLVLAKMLQDYPEVDVQESRDGRIVHRSALELGIIYDYILP